MILNEVMKETADAIREKTGKSELIKPVDFATEIKVISAGGGESGGDTVEYLDLRNQQMEFKAMVCSCCELIRASSEVIGGEGIAPPALLLSGVPSLFTLAEITIYGEIDLYKKINVGREMTIKDFIDTQSMTPSIWDTIPRITKEQFYDLNA